MTEAFIYDAIRTLRGRGKDIGSAPCDEPISLIQGLLGAAPERNPDLDKQQVEDIILACVSPIGGQGGNIARTAAIAAGFEPSGPAFSSTRSAHQGWRRSMSPHRRCDPAGRI